MKREFLKDLGIEGEAIDKIMAEHGKGVQDANNQVERLTTERDGLKEQLEDHNSQLEDLKKSSKDNKELQDQLAQLQEANKNKDEEWQQKLADQSRDFKINEALRDSKARNPKAVLGLLDLDKVTVGKDGKLENFNDQLEEVQKNDSYLFDTKSNQEADGPKGVQVTSLGNPSGGNGGNEPTMVQKIAQRMSGEK
ncbi:phage scaffolding protein [Ligilactobacillus acidipiscis]|uniref:Phage capsid and scaffold n=1 Tax=Ligilactobacillus acidipiscis TaxID=89059 RepID=A0A1K1KSW9_9LACO|nr:phage scaffolding protein [Ligilactobacillus acidipiscis]SFV40557.1 Phage capsid and scaffold [Ligilactobacillus acidipiscis]